MVAVFVVATFITFILIDGALQWSKARKQKLLQAQVREAGTGVQLALAPETVAAPTGLFLDPGHTWLSLDASGRSKIGADAFAPVVMGRIDSVELPEAGKTVTRGERLFAVSQAGRKAYFTAPVDGVVTAVNSSVAREPALLKADPYQRGWVCVLNPTNLARDLKMLMVGEETKDWIRREIERFREFFSHRAVHNLALGHVMQDGGEITGGVLEMLDDQSWKLFSQEFLRDASCADR
ncbi:MAG: hypothetical protein EHM61_26470 [Acidobacteria bacterium]|nr:MAG: hypothetical protein EHM61_26470 [Acidobacteriota bacterium]